MVYKVRPITGREEEVGEFADIFPSPNVDLKLLPNRYACLEWMARVSMSSMKEAMGMWGEPNREGVFVCMWDVQ